MMYPLILTDDIDETHELKSRDESSGYAYELI